MISTSIPNQLRTLIGSEKVDFVVKAQRDYPRDKAYKMLFFSIFWNFILSIVFIGSFKAFFKNIKLAYSIESLQIIVEVLHENLSLELELFFGLFMGIGVITLFSAGYYYLKKGGYFVGTATRLIKYRKGKIETTDWEQFTGNTKIKKKGTFGSLTLELRTGKMQSRSGESGSRYIPDIIYLVGVENVLKIEKKCKTRIKENDPTPIKHYN